MNGLVTVTNRDRSRRGTALFRISTTTSFGLWMPLLLISLAGARTTSDLYSEASTCSTAFEARLNDTVCKVDKLSFQSKSNHFPAGWAASILDALHMGFDSCTSCEKGNAHKSTCAQCYMYCDTLDVVQGEVEALSGCDIIPDTTEESANGCSDNFQTRISYIHDKQNDFIDDANYPASWFASLLAEFLDASEWCSRCGETKKDTQSNSNCDRCSATCQLTNAYAMDYQSAESTSIASTSSKSSSKDEIMGLPPKYTKVARSVIWVAKRGAIATGLVAGAVATLLATLAFTRFVDRWVQRRIKRDQHESPYLLMHNDGSPHYTEF